MSCACALVCVFQLLAYFFNPEHTLLQVDSLGIHCLLRYRDGHRGVQSSGPARGFLSGSAWEEAEGTSSTTWHLLSFDLLKSQLVPLAASSRNNVTAIYSST